MSNVKCISAGVLLIVSMLIAPLSAQDDAARREEAIARYRQFIEAVQSEVLTPDKCPYSAKAVAMSLSQIGGAAAPAQGVAADAILVKALAFVRGAIEYEPYVGVVRGAEGTLTAAAGNDWDTAVLLQQILIESGYRARLVVTQRSDAEAAAVVDAFLKQESPLARNYGKAAGNTGTLVNSISSRFGIPSNNAKIYSTYQLAATRRHLDEAYDAAAVEAPHLEAALAGAGKLGQPFEQWRKKLIDRARERVNVVVETKEGVKQLACSPDGEAKGNAAAPAYDTPPADRVARVKFWVDLAVAGEGADASKPTMLIEREMALETMFRRPVRLEIVPSDEAASNKPVATWTDDDWSKYVTGFKQFQVILRVGDEWNGSKAFDLDGNVLNITADGRIDNASKIGGGVTRGFGGFMGGGGEEEAKPTTKIEALTFGMQLLMPGAAPMEQRRLIYGTARTDVATPLFTTDLLATPGPVGPLTISWLTLESVARNAPLAINVVSSHDPRRFQDTEMGTRMPSMLHEWNLLRMAQAQRMIDANPGLMYAGGPSIVMHNARVVIDSTTKKPATRHSIDVAFDEQLLLPRTANDVEAAAKANLMLGIASTALESAMLRRIGPELGARGAVTASQEARAASAKPYVMAWKNMGSSKLEDQPAPPKNAEPLTAWSVARNEFLRTLVFPSEEKTSAWWSVNLATGQSIGRGNGGEGDSAMEYVLITKRNIDNLKCMVAMSNQVLSGKRGMEVGATWLACHTQTDNPGSGHGVPGAAEGWYDMDKFKFGGQEIGLGVLADALGGAKDLYDYMNQKDPILFTGRN